MPARQQRESRIKPSDKYARSDQAPPPGKRRVPQFLSDDDAEDVIEGASEDSFPASDPPAYTHGHEVDHRPDESGSTG